MDFRARSFRSEPACRSPPCSPSSPKRSAKDSSKATGSACARPSVGGSSSTTCWRFLSAAKVQVADRVSEFPAPRLELRKRSFGETGRRRFEQFFLRKHVVHVLGVIRPVG